MITQVDLTDLPTNCDAAALFSVVEEIAQSRPPFHVLVCPKELR